MKAYRLYGVHDLRLEEVPVPEPSEQEVLVEVKAAGICGSDIPRIYRTGARRHPLIPGHEFSGKVAAAGPGAEQWLGSRVGVFPLIPCLKCEQCRKGRYEMCRDYSYLGSRRDGGFAEYAVVPARNLLKLPGQVTYEEAAMLEPMAVAVHAMRQAFANPMEEPVVQQAAPEAVERDPEPCRNEAARGWPDRCLGHEQLTMAVCGLGTIGLLLVMFLLDRGRERVFAVGNKDIQREKAALLGLPEGNYCDSRVEDVSEWLGGKTGGEGADVVFECVGKNETIAQAIQSTAPAGRIVLVGNPDADLNLGKNVYWNILRRQLTVVGTWNSSFTGEQTDDWNYVLARLSDRSIVPAGLISHTFTLQGLEEGLRIMRDKTEGYVKMMMRR